MIAKVSPFLPIEVFFLFSRASLAKSRAFFFFLSFRAVIMADGCALDTEKYSLLEDFNVDVEVEKQEFETFSLCFWVYLLDSTTYPSTIIRQVRSRELKVSFFFSLCLVLSEKCSSVRFCNRVDSKVPTFGIEGRYGWIF